MPAPTPRDGSLSELSLCEILAALCEGGETGILRLNDGDSGKAVYLREGKVVFASSEDPDDRLGELLLTRGLLTQGQLEQASQRVGPGKRLGTILVELGFLPAQDLPRWVLEQVKEIIFALFSWTDGTFHFEPGPLPSREVITLRLSTAEIFLTGLRRVQKWSVLRKGTGDIRVPYRLSPDHPAILKEVELGEEERTLLSLMEPDKKTMEEAAAASSLTTLRVYQIFFAFRALGVLIPAPPPAPRRHAGKGVSEAGSGALPTQEPSEPDLPEALDPGATIRFTAPPPLRPAPGPEPASPPRAESLPSVYAEVEEAGKSPAALKRPAAGAETVVFRTPPPLEVTPAEEEAPARAAVPAVSPGLPREEVTGSPAGTSRKPEYRVIRVEGDKLDGNGVRNIEEVLGTWSRKGFRLAAVVHGRASGLFGSAAPSFFIFARD